MPRYRALARYWRQFPPVHLLLRALVGFKPAPTAGKPATSDGSAPAPFDALAAMAPGGTLNVSAFAPQ